MIDKIDYLIEGWADEMQNIMERSCLNYPNASSIARINEGGSQVPGSKCPEMFTSRRTTIFQGVYKEMRNSWKKIIFKRYIEREKLSSKDYHILELIHHWVDGHIVGLLKE